MNSAEQLTLPEELMLLSLRDREGTDEPGAHYHFAIGGAIVAELMMSQRIGLRGREKKKLVTVKSSKSTGDSLIDGCLDKIKSAKKPAYIRQWIGQFANMSKLKHRVAQGLCDRGILRMDQDKVFLLFTRNIYPEVDPKPERAIIDRLDRAIFGPRRDVDPRTVVLISLAHRTGILNAVFDKKKLKGKEKRIQDIIKGELTGKLAKELIEAMNAAIVVTTVIIPTVT